MTLDRTCRTVAICLIPVALFASGAMQAAPQKVIEAEEFRLVDAKGRTRARLLAVDGMRVGLHLLAPDGSFRSVLGLDAKDRPFLSLNSASGKGGLTLLVDTVTQGSNTSIAMNYDDGGPGLRLSTSRDAGTRIEGSHLGAKAPGLELVVAPNGLRRIDLNGDNGRIDLSVTPAGQQISAGKDGGANGVRIHAAEGANAIAVSDNARNEKILLTVTKGEPLIGVTKDGEGIIPLNPPE